MKMVLGVGTDIIRVSRVRRLIERYPTRFLRRILTPAEREAGEHRHSLANYAAKRFAAKEAFVKALGTGFRYPAGLSRISVLNDTAGKPYFVLDGELRAYFSAKGFSDAHVSLSDDGDWSFATVILTS